MRLTVNNLGPIRNNSQSIDLSKRFYVFVGKNNSGKTYFTQLLWTLFNQETINDFVGFHQGSEDLIESHSSGNDYEFEITDSYITILLSNFVFFLKIILQINFNTKKHHHLFNDISIEFDFDITEIDKATVEFTYGVIKNNKTGKLESLIISKSYNSRILSFRKEELSQYLSDRIHQDEFNKDIKVEKEKAIMRVTLHILLKHVHDNFFLPANRLFYSSFYQYIYQIERNKRQEDTKNFLSFLNKPVDEKNKINSLIDRTKSFQNLYTEPIKLYTEPINKIFAKLYSLNMKNQSKTYYSDLLSQVFDIMGGSISIDRIEEIAPIDFVFKLEHNKQELPMYLASSSVNQLTLLYLYLKYWAAEKNNFLMVDEPEENLYLDNQIALVDILIQFSKMNNNKVLLTTHSPLMANVVNSYLHLGTLKEKYKLDVERIIEKENLKYLNPETFLKKDNVGVYFFTGEEIIDYEAKEYGIYFRDFGNINRSIDKTNEILTDYIYLQDSDDE